ncbi:MAG TPA: metal-sensitive transcriptional regulator [Patescibacteria group bacterium]|nr:metal-sensitive transcriptional regulator [Patescibacteria group bacterium]
MKTIDQLINNIIGQLEGSKKMIKEDQDCYTVLTQLKASKSAINSVMDKLVEQEILECSIKGKNKKEKDRIKQLMRELIKNN